MKRPIRPPGRLTQAAYARHRGCDPKEVRRAIKAGRIALEKNGYIDPAKADASWTANTNPAAGKKPGMKPRETTLNKKGGAPNTFTDARTRSELAKARLAELRALEKEGQLIDAQWAKEAAFAFTRRMRDHLHVWPSRIAALMAAEIGVDAHLLEVTLDRHIRDLLRAMADLDVEAFAAKLPRRRHAGP